MRLACSYPKLVKANLKAGLHRLRHLHQVGRHHGKLVLTGAFAVVKDDTEDRVITDPAVNDLLDPDLLPRPQFAWIPAMRTVTVPRQGAILISKRDARHYFHSLKIGKRWHRWLCGPPVAMVSGQITTASKDSAPETLRYPACAAAPMGFGPSAGWAQGLTDTITRKAGLPSSARLHPSSPPPSTLPIWGSIVDDIWCAEHSEDGVLAEVGRQWMGLAEDSWVDSGVEPNFKKNVDGAAGEEVQGYYVHPWLHWVGVSVEKRRWLVQGTFHVLAKHKVLIKAVDRLVGKHGFVHSARPCLRSLFEECYAWLDLHRDSKEKFAVLPPAVWMELCMAALFVWHAQFNLSSPWSNRLECSDASLTGIGRAWGYAPTEVIQAMATYCNHPSTYTNLSLPWGIGLTEKGTCPLKRVRLPVEKIKWQTIGAPWGSDVITLGEADAAIWSAEDRLRRKSDFGHRFVHPLDSAATVGAFSKGRSPSKLLNRRCRKLCSIKLSGGYDAFYPWIPSKENPADAPSRLYEGQGHSQSHVAESYEDAPCAEEIDLHSLPGWAGSERFFLHFCSGTHRDTDVCSFVEMLSSEHGLSIHTMRIDPLVPVDSTDAWYLSCPRDLFFKRVGLECLTLIQSDRVLGGGASPPCSSISAIRHLPLPGGKGPRPLRSRKDPFNGLPGLTLREQHAVDIGSVLFLICLGMLGEIRLRGGWIFLEHPADRLCEPFASFFSSVEVTYFKYVCNAVYELTHQCMFGSLSQKATGLLLPKGRKGPVRTCVHRSHGKTLFGLNAEGKFHTTEAAKYPPDFARALAEDFVGCLVTARERGYHRALRPVALRGDGDDSLPEGLAACLVRDPWTGTRSLGWKWPQPSTGFLADKLEAVHSGQVLRGSSEPQQ